MAAIISVLFVIPDHWRVISSKLDNNEYIHIYVIINNKLRRLCSVDAKNSDMKVYWKKNVDINNGKVTAKHGAENLAISQLNTNFIDSGHTGKNGQKLYNFIVPYGVDNVYVKTSHDRLPSYKYFLFDSSINASINDIIFNKNINNISQETFGFSDQINNIKFHAPVERIHPDAFIYAPRCSSNIDLPDNIKIHVNNRQLFAYNQKDNSYTQIGYKKNSVDNKENSIIIPNGVRCVYFSDSQTKCKERSATLIIPEGVESISGNIPGDIETIALPDDCEVHIEQPTSQFYVLDGFPTCANGQLIENIDQHFQAPSIAHLENIINDDIEEEYWMNHQIIYLDPLEASEAFNIRIKWKNNDSTLKITDRSFLAPLDNWKWSNIFTFKIKKGDSIFEITSDMIGKAL